MKEFLLIWHVDEYPEMGGGTYFDRYETSDLMLEKANLIIQQGDTEIVFCGRIDEEYELEPVTTITKLRIK